MQTINMCYVWLFFAHTLMYAAESQDLNASFVQCEKAIEAGNLEAFTAAFSPKLLHMFQPRRVSPSSSETRPVSIVHLVAMRKQVCAGEMIKHMCENGLDPNEALTLSSSDSQRSKIVTPLPLELAARYANVSAVSALLQGGADPYETAENISFFKRWIKQFGENPRTYAERSEALAGLAGVHGLPGTTQDYALIAGALREAQLAADDDCFIQ